MKRVLVLCENIYYNNTSAGIVNTNILNVLVKKYKVDCLYNERYTGNVPEFYHESQNLDLTKIDFETVKGFFFWLNKIKKVRAIPAFFSGLNALDRIKIQNWYYYANLKIKQNEYNLVVVLGTGHEFLAHFAAAQLKTNAPVLLQIHDPFPLNIFPTPFAKTKKGIYKKLQYSFNKVLKKVNFVGFPSLELKNWMQQFYDFDEDQVKILPHPQSFYDLGKLGKQEVIENSSHFNLVHVGFLWNQRDPSALISAFEKFCSIDPERKEKAHLYLIGKTSKIHLEQIEKGNLGNLHLIKKRITYRSSLEILQNATASVLLEVVADISPIMPGKLADYININKPIIALTPKKSEVSRLLGSTYKWKTEVDNENEIFSILENLWVEWKIKKNLELNRPDLREYIQADSILKEIGSIIKDN